MNVSQISVIPFLKKENEPQNKTCMCTYSPKRSWKESASTRIIETAGSKDHGHKMSPATKNVRITKKQEGKKKAITGRAYNRLNMRGAETRI
ncbi:MAG: hypothetical protein D3908_00710 [Candidatus Electrothrix sp. AUS4]|nr:hypothetical protein [Candidatus Electrothrix sp. AUS4]